MWDKREKRGWNKNKERWERRQGGTRIQMGRKIYLEGEKWKIGNKKLAAEKWRDILPFNPYWGEQVQPWAWALCVFWPKAFVFQQQMLTLIRLLMNKKAQKQQPCRDLCKKDILAKPYMTCWNATSNNKWKMHEGKRYVWKIIHLEKWNHMSE